MDSQRNLLLIALMFVSFMLYLNWTQTTAPQSTGQGISQQAQQSGDIPSAQDSTAPFRSIKLLSN